MNFILINMLFAKWGDSVGEKHNMITEKGGWEAKRDNINFKYGD